MQTTRLSTKGQLVLPKNIRISRSWGPGTEFSIVANDEGILLRPLERFTETNLDDVAGCLRFTGGPKTPAQMRKAVRREILRRHDRGRY